MHHTGSMSSSSIQIDRRPHSRNAVTRGRPVAAWAAGLLAAIALAAPAAAFAQPRGQAPAGPTVAEEGSAYYRFEKLDLVSADGARHYRIRIALPRRAPPKAGYPAIYLLDGDAALAKIDDGLLARLDRGDPPVIVAIGYEGDRQFDVMARALDYTPPAKDGSSPVDPAGRPGGGADAFLDLVSGPLAQHVAGQARIDPKRRAIWGHSYGGLCVVHAALTRPEAFDAYFAASPSLWWNYGSVLSEVDLALAEPHPPGRQLVVMSGGDEVAGRSAGRRTHPMWSSVPPTAARDLVGRLGSAGVDASYVELHGLGHGGMLGASLHRSLLLFAGLEPPPPEGSE